VILENGVIRTLDPSLPLARSLAIAGDRIAGGVGTHETVLATPDVVDLGGRCVLPGFTDSHVHFPTWAMTKREVNLDGCASLAEAVERIRSSGSRRGYGWRDAGWPDGPPTRAALDAIDAERPVSMW
jgi:predicted amidohydrolase YtcJ